MTEGLRLTLLPGLFAVCRLPPDQAPPVWLDWSADLASVTRTADELSIVCPTDKVPGDLAAERDWRTFKVEGPLDFALVGILAELSGALAEAGVSLFAISTYDTDYLLVRDDKLAEAKDGLSRVCQLA